MSVKTVAEVIADELAEAGVDRVFGLPGGEVLHLVDALHARGIPFELCRHEADAGVTAAVYGKLKRVPGVVLVTLGPGAANLMFPLASSLLDREPLLALSAQIAADWPTSHTHQLLPLLESYTPVTRFAAALNPFTVRRSLRHALQASIEEPAGPSFLTLSAQDAIASAYDPTPPRSAATTASPRNGAVNVGDPQAAAAEIRRRLAEAERPLVLLGLGVRAEVAEKLRAWLDGWGLPVAVTPKVKGLVDETADNFLGVVGGMAIDKLMVEAIQQADLLLGFGFDPVEVDKTWHTTLPLFWVLESPLAMDVVPRGRFLAVDHEAALDALLAQSAPCQWDDPFASAKAQRRQLYAESGQRGPALHDNPIGIVHALAQILPPETIVTTDVGSHKYLFGQFWPSRQPETFFMSNGLSGMGYGLASAIGAKLARPESPVLAVLGDGGFSMNSQELETARRLGAPLIVLVLADNSYSLIQLGQESRGLTRYGVDFDPIDSVLIAQACGVDGRRATTIDELQTAAGEAFANQRLMVIEVPLAAASYRGIV